MATQRRALLSVSDKNGLVELARTLTRLSFELVSTGGTARALREAGLEVTDVSELTGFPEIMGGRVKTLHPAVHAGLLARRGTDDAVLGEHGLGFIDLLVVNLYPFERVTADRACTDADAIENIDIGGPAMLRAAAKNHAHVTVVVDAGDYGRLGDAIAAGGPDAVLRRELAAKAFRHTAAYDAMIAAYLNERSDAPQDFPESLTTSWRHAQTLRYGENPHQRAALYLEREPGAGGVAAARQLQGKPLSFNNLVDADAAWQCVRSFDAPACVIVKHANPCGVAVGDDCAAAYAQAYACDPTSAYGGVIAFNRELDAAAAHAIIERQFADVVAAPSVTRDAAGVFKSKGSIRVLACGTPAAAGAAGWELRAVEDGVLRQQRDVAMIGSADLRTVTRREPTPAELDDLLFAWRVVKFVKSNAIVYASGGRTVGIGAGQMSRVVSARIAALKAGEEGISLDGAVLASDAFFPFADGVETAAQHGITAVVQPGGSIRDDEVIAAADAHDVAMVFTGMRHFRH